MDCVKCGNHVSEIKEFRTSELYTLTQICPKCGVIAQTTNILISNAAPFFKTNLIPYR